MWSKAGNAHQKSTDRQTYAWLGLGLCDVTIASRRPSANQSGAFDKNKSLWMKEKNHLPRQGRRNGENLYEQSDVILYSSFSLSDAFHYEDGERRKNRMSAGYFISPDRKVSLHFVQGAYPIPCRQLRKQIICHP